MTAVLRRPPLGGIPFGVSNLRRLCESCVFTGPFLPTSVEEAGAAASDIFAVMAQRGGAVMRHRKG
jgi:hypothetical protein